MEKLIELLNEYKPLNKGVRYEYNNGLFIMYDGSGREIGTSIEDEILISKKYGFVKWLVKNDKISNDGIKPRKDLVKEITIVDYDTGKAIGWKNKYSETEQLLMYLAISEQPIELLCQILK